MLTLTRKDMLLTINDNVIPAMGSSDVPVKFVNDTETYQGFLIEPRVGYYVNGCPKSGICEYDTSSNIIKIPAEAFKNKGILVISIALIDSEDPNHIEVTKELALEVTPAPNGTIIFPSEDTWQTIVLNLINQFFVTSNEIKNQIKYAVDQAIEDGTMANMTIEDDSITGEKLKDEIISLNKLSPDLKNDFLDMRSFYEIVEDDLGTRLKCLTSDGNQFCKTDVVIDASKVGKYEIQVCLPEDSIATSSDMAPIFGFTAYNANDEGTNVCSCCKTYLEIIGNAGNINGRYGSWNISDLLSNKNKLTHFIFTKESRAGYYEDGTTWGWLVNNGLTQNGKNKIILPIYIFAINDSHAHPSVRTSKKPISIYYIRVFDDDDILIHEFLPYLDKNDKPCMIDTVTRKAYYNSGTGEFTYEEVEQS